jgi:hypothetical protein
MEKFFIKKHNPRYNMTFGGENSVYGIERKQNLSRIVKNLWQNKDYRESHTRHVKCPEYRKKCSERLKAQFKENPEHREKLNKACYNEKYHTEKIIDSTGRIYNSVEDVSKELKCRMNCITRVLSGKRHTFRNLQFAFLKDYEMNGFKSLPKNCGHLNKGGLHV